MGSKRGAAVLDAPEDEFTSEVDPPRRGSGRRPSMRRPSELRDEIDDNDFYDQPAFQRQRGAYKLRVRGGLPKSWVGRIAFAGGVAAIVAVLLAGIAELRSAVLHDSRFVVATSSDVQISGNEHVTRPEVLSVFGADLERNIFRVPLAERRADLERLPWVAHATVMRLLPDRIRVEITERTPVAFVRRGSEIGLVDANGVLLDMSPNEAGDPHYSFPVLTGLSANDPLSTRAARMVIYRRFMQELDSSGEGLTKNLSEVDVSDPEDVKAMVTSGGSDILVHFGDESFLQRYREFEQHLPEWKQQYPKLASADMRYERQVVLEVGGVATAAGGASVNAAAAPAAGAQAAGASASPKPAHVAAVSQPKTKRRVTAGKATGSNGRLFARLAAERRAREARAQRTVAAGAQ
ncbi:MAG TPA: FtsQ-type POTRA domain-containing protein [Acidobacteriaceae bacterium]